MPSTRRGPGRAKEALASTAQTGTPSGSVPVASSSLRQPGRVLQTEAAGRRDDDVRRGGRDVGPGGRHRPLAGAGRGRTHRRRAAPSRAPSARGRTAGRSTPAPRCVAAPGRAPGRRRRPGAPAGPRPGHGPRASCPVAAPTCTTEASTCSRSCGSVVSTSARQPRCSRAAVTSETSTAHTAHRSWVTTRSASRSASASAVEVVEVLTGGDPGAHRRVDRRRPEPLRQGAGGHDAARAGLLRVVALERHPDHVLARADREEDLGGRRQQRHDVHRPDAIPGMVRPGCCGG